MLTSESEKRICDKYSAKDANGMVHCRECPLNNDHYGVDMPPMTCKAIMHYNRKTQRWEWDDGDQETDGDGEREA